MTFSNEVALPHLSNLPTQFTTVWIHRARMMHGAKSCADPTVRSQKGVERPRRSCVRGCADQRLNIG